MVIVACPLQGCSFVTDDLDASIVAVLLQIHASSHSAENVNSMKGPKLDRPRIDVGADQEMWNSFLRRWENFRTGSNIRDSIAPVQLLQCASEELSEMLLKTEPRIASLPIDEVLSAMKSLAVIPVAKGIVRAELMQMRQANDQSFRAFAAKVRGKAETCGFTLTASCPCQCQQQFPIDYTVEVIRDVLLAGIGSADIKQEVLSADGINQKTINEIVAFVEKREMARSAMSRGRPGTVSCIQYPAGRTANEVMQAPGLPVDSNSSVAASSTFKRQGTSGSIQEHTRHDKAISCPGCGGMFHPFRKLRNGWNKKPFKECLSCWRAGRRVPRSSMKVQNAECAIAQALDSPSQLASTSPLASRVSAFQCDERNQQLYSPTPNAGNAFLS